MSILNKLPQSILKLMIVLMFVSGLNVAGRTGPTAYADAGPSAFDTIQAESYSAVSRAVTTGTSIGDLRGGNWVRYDDIDFGTAGAKDIVIRIALPAAAAGNKIEVRLDSPTGELIGTLITQATGGYGAFAGQATAVGSVGGVHDVYLAFVGGAGIGNIDWLRFNSDYSVADTAPPITQAAVAGDFNGTHYTSSVTVTLSAYDYYRGVASTVYSLDGGTSWSLYSAPLAFNAEGSFELLYRSTDRAGNEEAAHSLPLTLADLPLPSVFWVADALQPGDAALLTGENLGMVAHVEIVRLNDDDVGNAAPLYVRQPKPDARLTEDGNPRSAEPAWDAARTQTADLLQPSSQSFKFIVPESEAPGVFAIKPVVPGRTVRPIYVNVPDVKWAQGDRGTKATKGGWLRVNGNNLAADDGHTQVVLESADTHQLTRLAPQRVFDAYSVQVDVPPDIAAGAYDVYVHNGFGGGTAWSVPVRIEIAAKELWPDAVFDVKDYGAKGDGVTNDTAAVRDAVDAARHNGGGVVYFPRGRYHLTNTLELAPYTVIRGESQQLTQLFWSPYEWDYGELPAALIKGTHHFAVEDISLNGSRTGSVIVGDSPLGNVTVKRVRIKANPFVGHITTDTIKKLEDEINAYGFVDLVKLKGENVQIVDCDLYGPNRPFAISSAKGAYVKGNTFNNGYAGWYSMGGPDGLIFEDNKIIDADMTASGGGVNNLGYTRSQNVYFARNTFTHIVGNDREAMTLDGGGGVYHGRVQTIDGATLTLPDGGKDASWVPNSWIGAGVFILSGKGAGQLREIVSHTKDTVVLDSPFEVDPDASSLLSITAIQRNGFYVNNMFEDTGAFQFYGTAVSMVVYGNELRQSAGLHGWGRFVYNGFQPNWYVDFNGNRIADGNYFHWYGAGDTWSGMAYLRVAAQGDDTLNMGTLVRHNELEDNSYIWVIANSRPNGLKDTVISDNIVRNSDTGISIGGSVGGVMLYRNRFDNVDTPVAVPQALLDNGKVLILGE